MMTISMFSTPCRKQATGQCSHCGRTLITLHGYLHLESFPDLEDVPCECDCSFAKRERDHAVEQETRAAAVTAQKRENKRIIDSGLPLSWKQRTLDVYVASTEDERVAVANVRDAFRAFCVKECGHLGLFVIGQVGTGKTYLVSSLARSLQLAGKRIMWRNLSDVLLDFRECYKAKSQMSEQDMIAKYVNVPFLFLDDLGKEKMTEWAQGLLFALINKRTESERPTIVTANFGREGLISRLTPKDGDEVTAAAIVDRIIGASVTLKITGESRRVATLGKMDGDM